MNNIQTIYLVHSCLPLNTSDDSSSFILSIITLHNVMIMMMMMTITIIIIIIIFGDMRRCDIPPRIGVRDVKIIYMLGSWKQSLFAYCSGELPAPFQILYFTEYHIY